jgi:hypothetical protein
MNATAQAEALRLSRRLSVQRMAAAHLTQNPQFDWTTVTPAAYQLLWDQSGEQYRIVIGTDNLI